MWTLATTMGIYLVFLGQGILLARFLGPLGRGEFGSSIYFPRDLLLYAGLLGGVEIVNRMATSGAMPELMLKRTALRLGWFTGWMTAVVAGMCGTIFLALVGKGYLIPWCWLCCLFLPWEHMQLNVGAVDRGRSRFGKYNRDRLLFAIAFPVLLVLAWAVGLGSLLGVSMLAVACGLFVASRILGLLPTVWQTIFPQDGVASVQTESPAKSSWRLLYEGKGYAASTLATELFERMDVFLIMALATVEQSGFYFVAVPAAGMMIIIPNVLGVFTFNVGADPKRRVSLRSAIGFVGSMGLVQILATIVMLMLLPYLIVAFYGQSYAAAIPFALWLVPAAAIRGMSQAVDGYLKGRGRPTAGIAARFAGLVAMLLVVPLAWSRWELLSVPMAAVAGQALSFGMLVGAALLEISRRGRAQDTAAGKTGRVRR